MLSDVQSDARERSKLSKFVYGARLILLIDGAPDNVPVRRIGHGQFFMNMVNSWRGVWPNK